MRNTVASGLLPGALTLGLAALLAGACGAQAPAEEPSPDELERLRQEREEDRRRIESLEQQLAELRAALAGGVGPEGSVLGGDRDSELDPLNQRIDYILRKRLIEHGQLMSLEDGEGAEEPADPFADAYRQLAKTRNRLRVGADLRFAAQAFDPGDPFDRSPNLQRVIHRTRVHAEFNPLKDIRGYIEGQFFGNFGASDTRFENFQLVPPRSGALFDPVAGFLFTGLGVTGRTSTGVLDVSRMEAENDQLSLYQAFFDWRNILGSPVSVRVGRQELNAGIGELVAGQGYGDEFLIGNNDSGDLFFGASLDGVKVALDLTPDETRELGLRVDGWWMKPDEFEETSFLEDDSSPTFWGLYASIYREPDYESKGLEIENVDLALLEIRNPSTDPRAFPSTTPVGLRNTLWGNPIWSTDSAGRFLDRTAGFVQMLNSSNMFTLATHLSGFALEGHLRGQANLALQVGETPGLVLRPHEPLILTIDDVLGEDVPPVTRDRLVIPRGNFEAWAADVQVEGDLTFLPQWEKHSAYVGGGYTYFSGGDLDDFLSGDVGTFQRIMADKQYGEIMDRAPFGTFLSNVHIAQAFGGFDLAENLSAKAEFFAYVVDESTDPNGPYFGANPDLFGIREDLIQFANDYHLDEIGIHYSPLDPSMASPDRYLGSELDLKLTWKPFGPRGPLTIIGGWAHFFNGNYFSDSLPRDNALYREFYINDILLDEYNVTPGADQDFWFLDTSLRF